MNGVVTDLQGNVIWTLQPTLAAGQFFSPLKLLPNGHFLAVITDQAEGINASIVEYDLAGTVISTFTSAQLSTALATATCAGCQGHNIGGMHHDFALLPNGHMIVIVSETIPESGLTGQTGTVNVTRRRSYRARPKSQSGVAVVDVRSSGSQPSPAQPSPTGRTPTPSSIRPTTIT